MIRHTKKSTCLHLNGQMEHRSNRNTVETLPHVREQFINFVLWGFEQTNQNLKLSLSLNLGQPQHHSRLARVLLRGRRNYGYYAHNVATGGKHTARDAQFRFVINGT